MLVTLNHRRRNGEDTVAPCNPLKCEILIANRDWLFASINIVNEFLNTISLLICVIYERQKLEISELEEEQIVNSRHK